MKQAITEFLKAKDTEAFKMDEDKWKDYPFTFVNEKNEPEVGFIQDAEVKIEGDLHILNIVILRASWSVVTFSKRCKKPDGCPELNWDTLHCPFDVDLYN